MHAIFLVQIEVDAIHLAVFKQISGPSAVFTIHHQVAVGAEPYWNTLLFENLTHAILHELVRHVSGIQSVSPGHYPSARCRSSYPSHAPDEDRRPSTRKLSNRRGTDYFARISTGVGSHHRGGTRRPCPVHSPVEALRRLAQVNRQNAVAGGGSLLWRLPIRSKSIGMHVRDGCGRRRNLYVISPGVLGGFGFRETDPSERHRTLHTFMAMVTDRRRPSRRQADAGSGGVGQLAGLHQFGHVLQEVVDARACRSTWHSSGRTESLQPHILGHETSHAQRAKQPATAGTILMGGGAIVDNEWRICAAIRLGAVQLRATLLMPAAVTAFMAIRLMTAGRNPQPALPMHQRSTA